MEFLKQAVEIFLHVDKHLQLLCTEYGVWVYALLFVVIFCETGLVVTPFLPGDSLLFAVGSLAALGAIRLEWIIPLLLVAVFLGDNSNYWLGRTIGPKIFSRERSMFFNKEYLNRTHRFYDRHGKGTVIIARFLPIIRTFAPFVAGIGRMDYRYFLGFSIIGSLIWVNVFTWVGYYFGNVPFIKQHFSLVIVVLVLLPGLPAAVEVFRQLFSRKKTT